MTRAAFGSRGLGLGWHLHVIEIGGIALSTTSVAVLYAVIVDTSLNRRELGKFILAACRRRRGAPAGRSRVVAIPPPDVAAAR